MSTASSFEPSEPLASLRCAVIQMISANKQLTQELLDWDIRTQMPLFDPQLLTPNPSIPTSLLHRKLSHLLQVLTYHKEKLLRKVRSYQQEREVLLQEKEEMVGECASEYGFLREQWVRYRVSDGMDLDDRVDKLSKVVANIRGRVARKVGREAREIWQLPDEAPWERDKELRVLKEKLESSEMQKEELLDKFHTLQTVHQKTKQQNQNLVNQLKKTKDRLKAVQLQFLATSKRQQQVNDRLSKLQFELDKDKRKNKVTYTGKDFTLQVTQDNLLRHQLSLSKSLQQIRDFLESTNQNHNHTQTFMTIPKLNFEKRYSMVMTQPSETSEDEEGVRDLSNRSRRLKEVTNVKFARTSRGNGARMSDLQHSKKSFYTKLQSLGPTKS